MARRQRPELTAQLRPGPTLLFDGYHNLPCSAAGGTIGAVHAAAVVPVGHQIDEVERIQVDAPAMSDMLNHALRDGPVSPPDAVAMLDTAYLGHVIVLWSWALKQPNPDTTASTTVRFRSLDGRDGEIAVPCLTFTEPITTLAGAST